MNTEQLEKGGKLAERINRLQKQKEYWEKARKFKDGVEMDIDGYSRYVEVMAHYADFETIRVLQLAGINKLLDEAKTEFSNL